MMVAQGIQRPFGITVFGSALVRVEPDLVSLHVAVSRLAQQPGDAFREAREAAQRVRGYLAQAGIREIASSRVSLSESYRYDHGEHRFEGYAAKVNFHLLLSDLERIEEILSGVVEAGANEVGAMEFQSSRLKELRAEVRQRAVAAAREKAALYCQAAGVSLGEVVHIEDVNPDSLRGREGHVVRELQPDDEGAPRAFDPGSISVRAAVMVSFNFAS